MALISSGGCCNVAQTCPVEYSGKTDRQATKSILPPANLGFLNWRCCGSNEVEGRIVTYVWLNAVEKINLYLLSSSRWYFIFDGVNQSEQTEAVEK